MRLLLSLLLLLSMHIAKAQRIENIIVITTDGLRWQEVFKGMDTALANNSKFNQWDSANIYKKYYGANEAERRKKLMPFFWSTVLENGSIYGNREYDNKVDVENPYWFSYPGYSEIFTGNVDKAVNSNDYKPNPNENFLEFINKQHAYKNKVEAFGAWEAFNRILNEGRCGYPVVAAFDNCGGSKPSASEQLINKMLADSYKPFGMGECLDVFTHYEAMAALQQRAPKVLFVGYGETDEWAHHGHYKDYLESAHQVDAWIKQIWDFVQSDARYKNKTAIFIAVDHGRGDVKKSEWTSHGSGIAGANEIWFAVMAPGIAAKHEVKTPMHLYQKQFAQTITSMLGMKFTANHPVADAIDLK